ncbi:hypothetical protein B0T21DRAFT_435379 [Apiosordaria backusii]|uniref:Uncharacterized protein n=1 Tax=Apiosordaria backusii TaxID=314023 RepID=A0AA40EEY6_9PEZI|nr:hypothetical protein B0T21DRAFT_435379 [Apiosordaria backusii]
MCQLQHYKQIRCNRPLPLPTPPLSKSRRTSAEFSQQPSPPSTTELESPKICLATLTPPPTLIKCDLAKLLTTSHFNICWEPTPVPGGAIEAPEEIKEHARDKCRSCHYTCVPTRLSLDEMKRGLSCRTSPVGQKKNELKRSKSGMGRLMERVKSHHHGSKGKGAEGEGGKEKENDKGKGKVSVEEARKDGGRDGELEGFLEVNAGRW